MRYLAVLLVVLLIASSLILLNTIYPVLPGVANMTRNVGQSIFDNWQGFLFGKPQATEAPVPVEGGSDELSALIKAEVDKAIQERLADTGGSGSGLVVRPANQTSTNLTDIANSFSDEVIVYPDAGGQSGVIVPVFRHGQGSPYLYILTPIKQ